jgi:hypothetical protein
MRSPAAASRLVGARRLLSAMRWRQLVHEVDREHGGPVLVAIDSMMGARFVHDQLELAGNVRIADAQRMKGRVPLACKTDRINAWVLADSPAVVPEVCGPGRPLDVMALDVQVGLSRRLIPPTAQRWLSSRVNV